MALVGVIGGGISGLTAAYRLQQRGHAVRVFEARDRVGGVIETTRTDDFLVEHGPNSVRPSEPLEDLIADLQLEEERVWADSSASTRYVVRDGHPTALPTSVGAFVTTDLFSTRAKLRLLAEPFVPPRPPEAGPESLAAFTRRRLGPEVLDYAVAPFVGGVFAGDPEQLSVRHAFGRLVDLEREYGSLFWGAVRASGADSSPDAPSSLFSFRDGLETLPAALGEALADALVTGAPVTALQPDGPGWKVTVNPPGQTPSTTDVDAVVCTVPLHALQQIELDTAVDCSPLWDVTYPPVSVVALGYQRDAVAHPLDGFGLLVPPIEEQFDVLGTIFSSTLFPDRAPDDHVLLTTFLGGTRAPALAERPPSERQSLVERDLDRLLTVTGSPVFTHHVQWPRAIPQYALDYDTVTGTLRALESEHETLVFAGNYRDGVSVGDAVASGVSAADRVVEDGT